MRRIFDILLAIVLLIVSAPLILMAAAGIKLTSRGPIFFRASRVGLGGIPYVMLKLRTMHHRPPGDGVITAPNDIRVFYWGWILRNSKIDELPQLLNIIKGDMSFVGPRPEDPYIVDKHYTPWMMESLGIRPGITSPGTLFGFVHGGNILDSDDVDGSYIRDLLPKKLKLDLAYHNKATALSDIWVVLKTGLVILLCGLRVPVPELFVTKDVQ